MRKCNCKKCGREFYEDDSNPNVHYSNPSKFCSIECESNFDSMLGLISRSVPNMPVPPPAYDHYDHNRDWKIEKKLREEITQEFLNDRKRSYVEIKELEAILKEALDLMIDTYNETYSETSSPKKQYVTKLKLKEFISETRKRFENK